MLTPFIRLYLYYITHDAGFTYINQTGSHSVRSSILQGQKLNLASLSMQVLRLYLSPVSSANAHGLSDNKEIQQLGRCKREPWAQEYPLPDPHHLPHQSQSVSPNGNVPVCSRLGGRGGLIGGKRAAAVILMTNRGSSEAGGCWLV